LIIENKFVMIQPMKKYILISCFILGGCATQPVALTELIGKNQDYVRKQFGTPTVTRSEHPNQIWSYRDEDCSKLVFFDQAHVVRWVDVQGACEKYPTTNKSP